MIAMCMTWTPAHALRPALALLLVLGSACAESPLEVAQQGEGAGAGPPPPAEGPAPAPEAQPPGPPPDPAEWDGALAAGSEAAAQPLAELSRLAQQHHGEARGAFWNGVGQELPPPPDPHAFAAEVQRDVGAPYQAALWEGAVRAVTQAEPREVDRVLAFRSTLKQAAGLGEGVGIDGLRVGLRRALGADTAEALEVAARYPGELHAALAEELGWGLGDAWPTDQPGLLEAASEHRAAVPSGQWCLFLHGVVRGHTARQLQVGEPRVLDAAWPETGECVAEVPRAMARAIWEAQPEPEVHDAMVPVVFAGTARQAAARAHLARLDALAAEREPLPHPWEEEATP